MTATSGADRTLAGRASILEKRAKRLQVRKASAADAYALSQAKDDFSELHDDLVKVLAEVRVLRDAGESLRLPTPSRIAQALTELADRIDADPVGVRQRRQQTDMLTTYAEAVKQDVEARLEARVDAARGGAEGGLVAGLRQIGLSDAAALLDAALETLARFKGRLPRTAEELAEVDDAAKAIRETMEALEDPRHARLLDFFRRAVGSPRPTLADVDAALLHELQTSGAAANFVIVPRES